METNAGIIQHTEVIIVGGGPSGLALGALLAKHNIPFRIFEKAEVPPTTSRALAVQAGTLECLTAAFGEKFSDHLVQMGWPTRYAEFHIFQNAPIEAPLYTIPSLRNFILILEQARTEAALEEQLEDYGREVERGQEVVDARIQGEHIQVRVRNQAGEEQNIAGSFLVGCDGAHSFVRHDMNMPFEGGSYEGEFILGDVTLVWSWGTGKVHAFLRENGIVACLPLPDKRYRVIILPRKKTTVATGASETDIPLSLEIFRAEVRNIMGDEIRIQDSYWLSRFRVQHRIVQTLQRGRIFLVGDAAHIHSPIGGQGMNTGIQDALNLGMKIVRIYRHDEPQKILNDYNVERRPIAKKILRATDIAFRIALYPSAHPLGRLRNFILPFVLKHKVFRERILRGVSQVFISRKEIARYVDHKRAPRLPREVSGASAAPVEKSL